MVLCRMLGIMPEEVVKRLPVVMKDAAIARPLAAATKGGEGDVVDILSCLRYEEQSSGGDTTWIYNGTKPWSSSGVLNIHNREDAAPSSCSRGLRHETRALDSELHNKCAPWVEHTVQGRTHNFAKYQHWPRGHICELPLVTVFQYSTVFNWQKWSIRD